MNNFNFNNSNNLNNSNYREYLMKNTNDIMKQNCQNPNLNQVKIVPINVKTYPYLFNGIHDATHPYGYEDSLSKQLYISLEKMNSEKRNLLKNEL